MAFTKTDRRLISPRDLKTSYIEVNDHQAPNFVEITPAGIIANQITSTSFVVSGATVDSLNVSRVLKIPIWTPSTSYEAGQLLRRNSTIYMVSVGHTSQASPTNFYQDWLGGNLNAMTPPPGSIEFYLNPSAATGAAVLPLDGSEVLKSDYLDLYNYLNYGYTPIIHSFNGEDSPGTNTVINHSGFLGIQFTNPHGLTTGQQVYIEFGSSTGTLPFTAPNSGYLGQFPLFVYVQTPTIITFSTLASPDKYSSGNYTMVTYDANYIDGTGNTLTTCLWGHPYVNDPVTHFALPDFRSMFLRNAGTNAFISKYNTNPYSAVFGTYNYDRGLNHDHTLQSNEFSGFGGTIPAGTTAAAVFTTAVGGVNQSRANDTEVSPVHATVNYYLRY